jgi:hypothetical protein
VRLVGSRHKHRAGTSTKCRKTATSSGRLIPPGWFQTDSFSSFAGRKAIFLLALILIASPVAGLRPMRAARARTCRIPRPVNRTLSPFFRCCEVAVTSSSSIASPASSNFVAHGDGRGDLFQGDRCLRGGFGGGLLRGRGRFLRGGGLFCCGHGILTVQHWYRADHTIAERVGQQILRSQTTKIRCFQARGARAAFSCRSQPFPHRFAPSAAIGPPRRAGSAPAGRSRGRRIRSGSSRPRHSRPDRKCHNRA